jgi:hypothetical protein
MATVPTASTGEFEFTESQNQLIGSLSRKMSLVGFVMLFFGLLQMANGVTTLIMSRDPDHFLAAAERAGMPPEQIAMLRDAMSGDFWSSPIAVSSIAMVLAGLFLLLVGWWTRQAAAGFRGIVLTRGRDISRLMDALGALHRKYALMYAVLVVAAIVTLASILISVWQAWGGRA